MGRLGPREAAQYAIVSAALVLLGIAVAAPDVPTEQRGTVVAGVFAVLGAVAWWGRRTTDDG